MLSFVSRQMIGDIDVCIWVTVISMMLMPMAKRCSVWIHSSVEKQMQINPMRDWYDEYC